MLRSKFLKTVFLALSCFVFSQNVVAGPEYVENKTYETPTTSFKSPSSIYQEQKQEESEIQIVLVPRFESTLSSQINAKINNIAFKEGDSFKKGDVLIQFECDVNKANREKAQAEYKAAEKTLRINQRLDKLSSVSKLELGKAEAEFDKAKAELKRIDAIVRFCDIKAPFDGRIAEVFVNNHETVSQGKELIKILDDTSLEIEMFVPSSWLLWLKKGSQFKVKIDETGREYPAKVVALGARIDSVSQSLKIVARLDGDFPELIAGMGGQARFTIPKQN